MRAGRTRSRRSSRPASTSGCSTSSWSIVTDARSEGFEAVALTYTNVDVDRINGAVHRALFPDAELPYAPGEKVLFRQKKDWLNFNKMALLAGLALMLFMAVSVFRGWQLFQLMLDVASGRIDAVVNPVTDPLSGQPEAKHTPVNIEPYRPRWHGFILSARALASAASRLHRRVSLRYYSFYSSSCSWSHWLWVLPGAPAIRLGPSTSITTGT